MSNEPKPIEEWTDEELNAAGFDAMLQRDQAINQVRQLEQAINQIVLEKERRKQLAEQP
jgi:hypothetical protein